MDGIKSILSDYKYKSQDNSYISKLYYPFWIKLESLISSDIHPNTITFFGLFCLFFSYFQLVLNMTYISKVFFGFCIFLYMNLDAIDGIHARRIKKTSILGEVCDHLCDCVSNGLIVDGLCLSLNVLDNNIRNIVVSLASLFFIFSNYQAMITGIMKFEAFSDTSLILSSVFLLCIVSPDISEYMNNNFTYIIFNVLNLLCHLYIFIKESENILISFYTILKYFFCFFMNFNSPLMFANIDIIVLSEIISKKILNKRVSSSILLVPVICSILDENMLKYGSYLYFCYYFYKFSQLANRSIFDNDICVYYFSTFDDFDKDFEMLEKISKFGNIVKLSILSDKYCDFNFVDVKNSFENRQKNLDKLDKKFLFDIIDFPNMITYDFLKSNNIDYVIFDKNKPFTDFTLIKQVCKEKRISLHI